MTTTVRSATEREQVELLLTEHAPAASRSPRHERQGGGEQVNIYNSWPVLPLVLKGQPWDPAIAADDRDPEKRALWPVTAPLDVYRWGMAATKGFSAWVRMEQMPAEVVAVIGPARNQEMRYVDYVLAPLGGQSGGGSRNLMALIRPDHAGYQRPARPLYVAELGCTHVLKTTNLGRCYNRYDCTVPGCTYTFNVDSGD